MTLTDKMRALQAQLNSAVSYEQFDAADRLGTFKDELPALVIALEEIITLENSDLVGPEYKAELHRQMYDARALLRRIEERMKP